MMGLQMPGLKCEESVLLPCTVVTSEGKVSCIGNDNPAA